MELLKNRWFKFGFWTVLYILWVIWIENAWWLFGLPVIFDIFISRKVKWAFWKKEYKEGEKHNIWLEWLDAIIFAVIVVTFINIFFFQAYTIPSSSMEKTLMTGDYLFVSKLSYGPKMPERPLSLPFMHNTLPGSLNKSYSDKIQCDYHRLAGFGKVCRGDKVVFGFPDGDTILSKVPADDYYSHVRIEGREYAIKTYGPVIVRPRDKKDNYVKRCVAAAGDSIQVVDGVVIVNGVPEENREGVQMTYCVKTSGQPINPRILDEMDINPEELWFDSSLPGYRSFPLTASEAEKISSLPVVEEMTKNLDVFPPDFPDSPLMLFPYTATGWTRDNYGPLYVPAKGDVIALTLGNLPFYSRLITSYEGNELEVKDSVIYINGNPADSYTIGQDYYFMMGDNRHNSLDSRYWGFVPEDHIVGKPSIIWMSKDKNRKFPHNVRWSRLFNFL